ncbi:MAG TPA: hypothetical protein DCY12_07510 [Candidatus Atribacteria bacterium]|nr:hypothetical protein [Candidatus Atribacteria bacterium]
MVLRLALRGFQVTGGPSSQKTRQVLAEGSIYLFSPFQRTSIRLTARARAFVSDQPSVFATGRQDLGRKKWWGHGQRLGVTAFFSKMVGPRPQVGGNDFVVTMVLRPAAPERKQITLLAKADELELPPWKRNAYFSKMRIASINKNYYFYSCNNQTTREKWSVG